jgi:hypothetical protein
MPQKTGGLILAMLLATGAFAFYVFVLHKTYPIKIKTLDAGAVVKTDLTTSTKIEVQVVRDGQTLGTFNDKWGLVLSFEETILSKGPDPTEIHRKRKFEKAQATGTGGISLPIHGKTLMVDEKAGNITARPEWSSFSLSRQMTHRVATSEISPLFFPEKPVAINDAWALPADKIAKSVLEGERVSFQSEKAIGTGKLLRVYEKSGHQYGTLELHIEVVLKAGPFEPDEDLSPGQPDPVAAFEIAHGMWATTWNLDTCIDGSVLNVTGTRTDKMNGSLNPGRYDSRRVFNYAVEHTFTIQEVAGK